VPYVPQTDKFLKDYEIGYQDPDDKNDPYVSLLSEVVNNLPYMVY